VNAALKHVEHEIRCTQQHLQHMIVALGNWHVAEVVLHDHAAAAAAVASILQPQRPHNMCFLQQPLASSPAGSKAADKQRKGGAAAARPAAAAAPRWYVTAAELASVPSYIKGRLTLEKVRRYSSLFHFLFAAMCGADWRRCVLYACPMCL
jgi:hypothetical protein